MEPMIYHTLVKHTDHYNIDVVSVGIEQHNIFMKEYSYSEYEWKWHSVTW